MSLSPNSTEAKKARLVKIGTHNGNFHCDEVLACYMLRLLPEYKNAEIVRSRDPQILSGCDVVVDVGGEYDPPRHRYDHHQNTFYETGQSVLKDKPWNIKLSSAGLVYMHFGHRIIGELLKADVKSKKIETIFNKVYENFVREIDAIDNGVDMCTGEMMYCINTNLSSRVSHLNPFWNDPQADETKSFNKALDLVGGEFEERVKFYDSVWWPAREIVLSAVDARFEVDGSGEIVSFPRQTVPWKEHLRDLEVDLDLQPLIKFVLFTDNNGAWRVQTVPTKPGSFECRVPLKAEWRGLRDAQLDEMAGISDCVFVHASGFIGGNRSFEGALEMARSTLSAFQKKNSD